MPSSLQREAEGRGAAPAAPSAPDGYPLHHASEVDVAADAATLFAHLDDHRRLAAHMSRRSLMTLGATLRVDADAQQGRAVGSVIGLSGRVLGLPLRVDEVVVVHEPPRRKTWQTLGEPRLWVIGAYRMGFEIAAHGARSRLRVFIDYRLPAGGRVARWLGRGFARAYAAWCTERMAADAARAFAGRR